MESNKLINTMKNPNFLKEDIFLDYLIYNNSPLINEEFIKPKFETFDKFFNEEENCQKLNTSEHKSIPQMTIPDNPFSNFNRISEKDKISNGVEEKDIIKTIKNNKNDINLSENLDENSTVKKQIFSTNYNQKFSIEDLRKKKLIMNRESAKKSRLKKKKYIENLEKEFIFLKEELIRVKSSKNQNNNSDKFINDLYSNKVIENIIKNKRYNIDLNLNNKEKEIFELKSEEMNIISNDLEKNQESIKSYVNKQKNVLEYLLVKQIDIMTPIRIKNFQNKFLKLEIFEIDDNISIIKNKIDKNLSTIMELYDIDENNGKNNNICNKKSSMSYQIYDFYNSLKSYVNQYDLIFNKIEII